MAEPYVIRDRYTGVIVGVAGPTSPAVATEIRRQLERIFPGKVRFAVVENVASLAFDVELPEGAFLQRDQIDDYQERL